MRDLLLIASAVVIALSLGRCELETQASVVMQLELPKKHEDRRPGTSWTMARGYSL